MFDAAAGFGGYRESGFGRDGGKEVSVTDLIISSLIDSSVFDAIALSSRNIHISQMKISNPRIKQY